MSESDDAPADIGEGIASLVAKSLVKPGRIDSERVDGGCSRRSGPMRSKNWPERDEVNETARRHAEFFRDLIVPATKS